MLCSTDDFDEWVVVPAEKKGGGEGTEKIGNVKYIK